MLFWALETIELQWFQLIKMRMDLRGVMEKTEHLREDYKWKVIEMIDHHHPILSRIGK